MAHANCKESSMHKTFVSALLGAVLLAAGPAAAKPISVNACMKKQTACIQRCEGAYDIKKLGSKVWAEKVVACAGRTCQKQYDNCVANSVGSGPSKAETPPDPIQPRGGNPHTPPVGTAGAAPNPRPRTDGRAPRGGELADPDPISPARGPTATGRPAGGGAPAAPSAPPAAGPIFR